MLTRLYEQRYGKPLPPVEKTPSGKPYLADGDAFISISHTQGYVAVAYSKCHEVAVDIEQYGTRVKRVAHKFIREDEQVSIQAGNEIYAMLLHWSAKESLFKLLDVEGVDFTEHLHIHPFRLSSARVRLAGSRNFDSPAYRNSTLTAFRRALIGY